MTLLLNSIVIAGTACRRFLIVFGARQMSLLIKLMLMILVSMVGLYVHLWYHDKLWTVNESLVHMVAQRHTGGSPDRINASFAAVLAELRDTFPGRFLADADLEWIFINCGGWMGAMCLLRASITDYVLFFGTAMETSGHSGRLWSTILISKVNIQIQHYLCVLPLLQELDRPGKIFSMAAGFHLHYFCINLFKIRLQTYLELS